MHIEKFYLQTPKLLCSSACNTDIQTEFWIQGENAVAKTFVLQAGFWVQLKAYFFITYQFQIPSTQFTSTFKKLKFLFHLHYFRICFIHTFTTA